SRSVDASAPAWKSSGYSAVREMVAGRMTSAATRERVIIETRQYAKRQRTWFRHQLEESLTTRIDPDDERADRIARDWGEGGGGRRGFPCYPGYGGPGAVAPELGFAPGGRGQESHFIPYKQPFRLPSFRPRIYFQEGGVGRYPLFEYPPYDLALAVRMHEVVK